jgi:hypothetical protein
VELSLSVIGMSFWLTILQQVVRQPSLRHDD